MITQLSFDLYETKLGSERFERLARAAPELVSYASEPRPGHRVIWLDKIDESLPEVRSLMSEMGRVGIELCLHSYKAKELPGAVSAWRTREYDARDLEGCEVLLLLSTWVSGGGYKPGEPIYLSEHDPEHQSDLRHVKDFASVDTIPVCSSRARRVLEAAGLRGLDFAATRLMPRGYKNRKPGEWVAWETYGEPWWRIVSDVVLPYVAPSVQKRSCGDGRLLPRESPGGCYFVDGDYSDYELHFVRSELAALGPFDVASTFEHHPNGWVVVSRRFYEVCRDHGFDAGFRPVRIDEG